MGCVHGVGALYLWAVLCIFCLSHSPCSGSSDLWKCTLFILVGKRQKRFVVRNLTGWIVLGFISFDFREKTNSSVFVCCLLGAWYYTVFPKSHKFINAPLSGFGTISVYTLIWEYRGGWPARPLAFVHVDKTCFCAIESWVTDGDVKEYRSCILPSD